MNCGQIERLLASQERLKTLSLPPSAVEHLDGCPSCRNVILSLTAADSLGSVSHTLLDGLARQMEQDLRPVTPIRPAWFFAGVMAATFAVLVAIGAWWLKTAAVPIMGPERCAAVLLALGLAAALTMDLLTRQMVPGSRYRFDAVRLPVLVLAGLGAVFAALYPNLAEPDFLRLGLICLSCGLGFFVPAAAVFWMMLRRGAVVAPQSAGAAVGLLAGLTGTTVLEVHCPLQGVWHIVTWHLGVPLIGMLICIALAALDERKIPEEQETSSSNLR